MHDSGDNSPSLSAVEPSPDEPEPPGRLSINIVEEAGDWSALEAPETAIRAAAAALASHPQFDRAPGSEACVVLGDDNLLRTLNREYRGKDAPTNVLSFPFDDPRQLGDIVLAVETLRREADAQGIAPVHHLQHLVVHGLLHLSGFDHETDAEAEVMEGLEVEILASLGIPDPYAPADGPIDRPSEER
ncbi:MAG TPA: rRNA maturation RNase YbeY [Hyphomicrobiaceae bacterium]|nr:rRNA maturation RNase YbeY [Hyphomicrobiaceae bacterium]